MKPGRTLGVIAVFVGGLLFNLTSVYDSISLQEEGYILSRLMGLRPQYNFSF
jgi:hypothetical protein